MSIHTTKAHKEALRRMAKEKGMMKEEEMMMPPKKRGRKKAADGGTARLGSGKRFAELKEKLGKRAGVQDPAALAAHIGRQKYGKERFQELSREGAAKGGRVKAQFGGSLGSLARRARRGINRAAGNVQGGIGAARGAGQDLISRFRQTAGGIPSAAQRGLGLGLGAGLTAAPGAAARFGNDFTRYAQGVTPNVGQQGGYLQDSLIRQQPGIVNQRGPTGFTPRPPAPTGFTSQVGQLPGGGIRETLGGVGGGSQLSPEQQAAFDARRKGALARRAQAQPLAGIRDTGLTPEQRAYEAKRDPNAPII